MAFKSILIILVFVICYSCSNQFVSAELDLKGKNVCYIDVKKNETIQVKYSYPFDVYTYKFCPRFPFSCKTKKTELRIGIKPKTETKIIKVASCCEGYRQDGEKCKPYCPNTCVHGECNSPNVCDCQPGSGGLSCNITCPALKFGINCEYDCSCLTNPHCNKNYHDCSCRPGEISDDCRNICKCKLSICNPGFIGKNCETSCPAGTFGSMCIGKCLCKEENTLECSKINGDCSCKPNYYGIYCEYECAGKLVCDAPNSCKCVLEPKTDASIADNTLSLEREIDLKNNNHGLIFSLIGLLVIVISLSMFFIYRYKIQTKRYKREIKSYAMRFSTGGSNDQFDNPVYSYAATSSNIPSTYIGSTYTPPSMCSITTSTLPHPPRTIQQLNTTSLTTPRRPKQNGYLNELNQLPNDLFKKNALADQTNPNMIMKKDNTFNSNISNIYTTIDEAKELKNSYKNELNENFQNSDLKYEFSTNFNDLKMPTSDQPFQIPEDNDSVDLEFYQVTKKTNGQTSPFNDDEFSNHYDKPKNKSPVIGSQNKPALTYESAKPIYSINLKNESNESPNVLNQPTNLNHYDVLNENRTHYETLKKSF